MQESLPPKQKKGVLREFRKRFNNTVRKRDRYQCVTCSNQTGSLEVHHITDRKDMPNDGYAMENGITLCNKCHLKAEQWHWSNGTQWAHGMHPDDLYKMIGSSYEQAYEASLNLKREY